MKKLSKNFILCLPAIIILLMTVILSSSAQAAQLRAPQLNTPVNTVSGVKVSWNTVPKAEKYRVFVKAGSSASWKKLCDTKLNYIVHKSAQSGTAYSYTVRCISNDGKRYVSDFNRTGKRITYFKAPALNAFSDTANGVRLTWAASKGAKYYQIYYKTTGSWKALTITSRTWCLHSAAKKNTAYTYKVRCLNAAKKPVSAFGSARTHTYTVPNAVRLNAPALAAVNTAEGIRLSWNSVSGAGKYRILLKNGAEWNTVADTTDIAYLYAPATAENEYAFAIQCITADGKTAVSDASAEQIITYYEAPRITGVFDEADGARLSWNAAAGAAKYRVMINVDDEWEILSDTDALTYTHTTANHGASYTYTVCSLDENDQVISGYHDGFSHQYRIPATLPSPVIRGFENLENGLSLNWSPVEGAARYRVLTQSDNRWITLGETGDTSFIDTDVVTGAKKCYTVCCISADGKAYASAYDTVGREFTYIGAPEIRCENTSSGILLSWDTADFSPSCRLYLKAGENWLHLTDTAENIFLYTQVEENTEYRFTACYLNEQSEPLGPYSAMGYAVRYTPEPENPVYTTAMFATEVYHILGKELDIPTDPYAVLTRQKTADILCAALDYKLHIGEITLTDNFSDTLSTAVFFGYFIPDEKDRIYPNAVITKAEYTSLLNEVKRYCRLKGKRALAFGDSIMYGYGNNNYSNSNYGSCRIISEKYGMTFTSFAYCGATFGTCSNGRKHISDQIEAAHKKGCKADIIFLNGGTNDLALIRKGQTPDCFNPAKPQESTFSLGMDYSLHLIRYYWGKTPVMYTRNHNMVVSSAALEQQLGEYGLRIAKKHNAYSVDIYSDTDLNTEYPHMRDRYTMYRADLGRSDGLHPNLLGYITYYVPLESDMLASILIPE